jgi:hypothetical protein
MSLVDTDHVAAAAVQQPCKLHSRLSAMATLASTPLVDHGDLTVIVVYGAPGTGKSTLLHVLERNDDDQVPFHFAVLHEPTSDPAIVAMIKQAYDEQDAAASGASSDVAARVQHCIMDARAQAFADFCRDRLSAARAEALRRGKPLVVVSDGHPATDMMIYVTCKLVHNQITEAQCDELIAKSRRFGQGIVAPLVQPHAFLQLRIGDDADGRKHWNRVCVLRQSEAESNVQPQTFAELAKYADLCYQTLAAWPTASYRIDTDELNNQRVMDIFLGSLADLFCK